MSKLKKNPNLCVTKESLIRGEGSLYRISGLFKGKARVCWVGHMGGDNFQATTAACHVEDEESMKFTLKDASVGEVNIMCIERGK